MKLYKYRDNREDADKIRRAVFLDEQQFSTEFSDEDDEFDYITLYLDNVCVGTVRYQVNQAIGIIGRLALLQPFRNKGYGKELVLKAEEKLKEYPIKEIRLHAQERKVPFYQKLGYEVFGDFEMDEYMPHWWMKKEVQHESN